MDSPFMDTIARGLADRQIRVVRFEFPYMERRRDDGKRRPPDGHAKLRARWLEVVGELGHAGDLVIGGKSMGGRIASMIADEIGVRGLVCLGYPFHPVGKPDKLRVAHLETIRTPTLILQGTRDALGNRAEIDGYALSKNVRVEFLEDGDHSFKPRARSGRTEEENLRQAIDAVATFVERI
jgi:predicted alpha/beta-hydrolase family hydrolase